MLGRQLGIHEGIGEKRAAQREFYSSRPVSSSTYSVPW